MAKKPTITETIRLNRLNWFGCVQKMEENRIPQKSIIHEFGNNPHNEDDLNDLSLKEEILCTV